MSVIADLKVKLFADGADLAGMKEMHANPPIKGFTTNPTQMRKAGVQDYREFARQVLKAIPDRPISFRETCRSSIRFALFLSMALLS